MKTQRLKDSKIKPARRIMQESKNTGVKRNMLRSVNVNSICLLFGNATIDGITPCIDSWEIECYNL